MEFWGIDRSRVSLRLKALERLGRIEAKNPTGELQRLSSVLASPQSKNAYKLPMSNKEFEILLVLAKNAEAATGEERDILAKQLSTYFVEILDAKIATRPGLYEVAPWQMATKELAKALLLVGSPDVFSQYMARAQKLWTAKLSNDALVAFAFSLRGFFEGLAGASLNVEVAALVFDWTRSFLNTDFMSSLHGSLLAAESHFNKGNISINLEILRLFSQDTLLFPGPTQLAMSIADFIRNTTREVCGVTHAGSAGASSTSSNTLSVILASDAFTPDGPPAPSANTDFLAQLAEYSAQQIKLIEGSYQFRIQELPHLVPLSARSMWYYFEPIGAGVFYHVFDVEHAAVITGTAMEQDQVDSRDDALLNLIRLAMITFGDSETEIVKFTKGLSGYLGAVSPESASKIGTIFAKGISNQPQSLLVSTIYTLINSLNIDEYMLRKRQYELGTHDPNQTLHEEPFSKFAGSILHTVVSMVVAYKDPQVNALAVTVLSQKYNSVSTSFDIQVLLVMPILAPHTAGREFDAIMNFIDYAERDAIEKEKPEIIHTIEKVRVDIAQSLKSTTSETRLAYLNHLLTLIVSKGDTAGVPPATKARDRKAHGPDLSSAATEATMLFSPLAHLLPAMNEKPLVFTDRILVNKFRDAWFNLVVLGFSRETEWTAEQHQNLLVIARSSPSLVMESQTNQVDSDLDLNPVLRRGSTQGNLHAQRKVIGHYFNREVRNMSYLRLMFISATITLEGFRAQAGLISHLPQYFGDPDFRDGDGNREMQKISNDCVMGYIKSVTTRRSNRPELDLDVIADQLREIFIMCCHRVDAIRRAAQDIANALISQVPSALCHKTSLFALLDLLTLMWQSCVDAEEDEYEPRSTFRSARSNVEIHLSDYYDMRRHALKQLLNSARIWSKEVLSIMPDDFKSILAFYLDNLESDEDGEAFDSVALGRSFALELGGIIPGGDSILPASHRGFSSNNPDNLADGTSGFLTQYLSLSEYKARVGQESSSAKSRVVENYTKLTKSKNPKPRDLTSHQLRKLYIESAQFVSGYNPIGLFVVKKAVHVPFRYFDGKLMKVAISFWSWVFNETPELRMPMMQEVADHWARSIDRKIGLFNRSLDVEDPMYTEMHYAPTDKKEIDRNVKLVEKLYEPHSQLIGFFKSGFHASVQLRGTEYIDLFARMIHAAMDGLSNWGSLHPLARTYRMQLIGIGLDVLIQYRRYRSREARILQDSIIKAALSWYKQPAKWAFGGNLIQQRKDMSLLRNLVLRIGTLFKANTPPSVAILLYLLEEELSRLEVWYDPLGKSGAGSYMVSAEIVDLAWAVDPEIAVNLFDRNYDAQAYQSIVRHVVLEPLKVIRVPKALSFFLESLKADGRFILYWAQSSPLQSINLFGSPKSVNSSYVLQYAMRSLESHPITTCFFYVPQIVQLLRHDEEGYVEEYILEAAKFSQLFAHQIIWNILANSYRDDDAQVPDPMKPTLDRVVSQMKQSFTPEEQAFYDREFSFFNEVTDISGKLKPYIKKSKAEKKAKIDQEMAVIKVPEGVYLPSHPLGTVADIDRDSGRPLQSHAKAPFLAKFKIRHDEVEYSGSETRTVTVESWQGAIFKVGDDCRQDVLAIQIISVFRSIFNASGLDTFVFPYKVTATAPGCGVIDVLPNSISRDMLGREAVNGLYEYFITKYGGEDSIAFQRARNNFVKSMAAYSIISYLLQFKDRHNGNIMYDDDGHIIHIDFGFCFEICPGGVKFEAAPFKLTKEMVAVMGGSQSTQAYKWFEELCVKAFLSCRVYSEEICQMVVPMLESGLPCFKGETIKKLRGRFVLHKTDREAAQYVRGLIRKSYESTFTTVYDEFQRITNGIPY